MNSTEGYNETTKNLALAYEEYLANYKPPPPPVSKLIYTEDGIILGITEDKVINQLWQPVDRKDFESKHGCAPYHFLRIIDDKIIDTRPSTEIKIAYDLVPGDTWHADTTFRLIVGEKDANTNGWSKRDS